MKEDLIIKNEVPSHLIPPPLPESAPQLSLIKHIPAPPLIFAGAGTGKTTTIIAKSAHMVEKENINPSTFTPETTTVWSFPDRGD